MLRLNTGRNLTIAAIAAAAVLAFPWLHGNLDRLPFAVGFAVVPVRRTVSMAQSLGRDTILFLSVRSSSGEVGTQPGGGDNSTDTMTTVKSSQPILGINLATSYSLSLNETDRLALQQECRELIDKCIAEGIIDLQELHDNWERDVEEDMVPLAQAMTLNSIRESERFATKLDAIVGTFWNQTAFSRQRTHELFEQDTLEQKRKAREEADRKAKKRKQSWKKTNDAWDAWDDDNW